MTVLDRRRRTGVSARSSAVLRYDAGSGDFLGALVTPGSAGLNYPHYAQFQDGILYLAGKRNDNILMYDADSGAFLGQLVAPRSAGLNGPRGLLILPVTRTCCRRVGCLTPKADM